LKILHTADWHIGKLLAGRPRLLEQDEVLTELGEIADREAADVILVAGDIFDTATPAAAAQALFYRHALRLSAGRHLVAIAGNHDDPERLKAPEGLAAACNIILAGGGDYGVYDSKTVTGGPGFVRIRVRDETLNLALAPFPSLARLGEKADEKTYEEIVRAEIDRAAACFTPGGINVLCAHLFLTGSLTTANDERELGSAKLVSPAVLPHAAVYTALGHIHKPFAVPGHNARYSGSLLSHSFDDASDKQVLLVETDGTDTAVRAVPLTRGKRLKRRDAHSAAEALDILDREAGAHVEIVYRSQVPLTAGEMREIRKKEAYANLLPLPPESGAAAAASVRRGKSDRELFEQFYHSRTGTAADGDTVELFMELLAGSGEGYTE
jgi:exonuclease SbcD